MKRSLVAVGVTVAALAYDPLALAADPKRVAALLLAMVLGGVVLAQGSASKPTGAWPGPLALFAAFSAVSAISLTWGSTGGIGDLAIWVGALAVGAACLQLPRSERVRAVHESSAAIGALTAVIAVVQALLGARGAHLHAGHGSSAWAGLLIAVTFLPTLELARRAWSAGGFRRWVSLIALLFHPVGLALTSSRVAIAASLVALVWYAASRLRRARALVALALFGVLAMACAACAAAPDTLTRAERAWQGRVWIWSVSRDAALSQLVSGVGLGKFAESFLDTQGQRLANLDLDVASRAFVNATTAHSDWLQSLVESGPLALLLLAASIGLGIRKHHAARSPACSAALVALAIAMLGDCPLRQPAIALLAALLLASAPGGLRAPRPRLVAFGTLLVLSGLAFLSTRQWFGMRLVTRSKLALPAERAALLASAVRVDPLSGEAHLERGLSLLEAGDAREALAELERSRALLPDVGTDVAIASAATSVADLPRARLALERALRRHPASFKAHVSYAALELAVGNLEAAEEHLAKSASLWPGHPRLAPLREAVRRAKVERESGG